MLKYILDRKLTLKSFLDNYDVRVAELYRLYCLRYRHDNVRKSLKMCYREKRLCGKVVESVIFSELSCNYGMFHSITLVDLGISYNTLP